MINIETYENYFKTEIVARYAKLVDFFPIDLAEFDNFMNSLRQGVVKTPCLAVEPYQIRTIAQKHDNIHNGISGRCVVLGNFNLRAKTATEKKNFLTEMEEIIMQVRAKMILDSKKPCNVMYGLIPESISIARTEIIAGSFQGYAMDFYIADTDETELSNDWV